MSEIVTEVTVLPDGMHEDDIKYRFETLDAALRAARSVVNDVKSMGRTFAEFGPRRAGEILHRDRSTT